MFYLNLNFFNPSGFDRLVPLLCHNGKKVTVAVTVGKENPGASWLDRL
jgi:hypothetical protein